MEVFYHPSQLVVGRWKGKKYGTLNVFQFPARLYYSILIYNSRVEQGGLCRRYYLATCLAHFK